MIRILAALALAATPTLAAATQEPLPQLSLDHRMLLRCSAAFALAAYGQDNGNAAAMRYPALQERGREFFVRASVQVMDEAGLTREQVASAIAVEAQDLVDSDTLEAVIPVCLTLLPDE